MFIKLTHVSGRVMYVNSIHIIRFCEYSKGVTVITFDDGSDNFRETPEQICEMLGVGV